MTDPRDNGGGEPMTPEIQRELAVAALRALSVEERALLRKYEDDRLNTLVLRLAGSGGTGTREVEALCARAAERAEGEARLLRAVFAETGHPTKSPSQSEADASAIRAIVAERDALTAQLAAARADVERLDWLEATAVSAEEVPLCFVFDDAWDPPMQFVVDDPQRILYRGRGVSLRAAIDAAKGGA